MAQAIRKLTDVELLIDRAENDYIVTGDDWQQAMQAIRDAVNKNADALNYNVSLPYAFQIGIAGSTETFTWQYNPSENNYYCYIPQVQHGKTGYYQVYFYNELKTAIQCNYQVTDTQLVIVSRVNKPVYVVLK